MNEVTMQDRLAVVFNEQNFWIRMVLDYMPDGVIVTDQSGHIVYVNPVMSEILGYKPGELLAQYVGLIIAPEDRERHSTAFHNFVGRLKEDEVNVSGQPEGQALTKSGEMLKVRSRVFGAFHNGIIAIIAFFDPIPNGWTREET